MAAALAGLVRRHVNVAGFAACVGLMGAAFFFEYVLKLQPCNMCMLQRITISTLGMTFLLAAIHDPGRIGARIYAFLIAIAAGVAIALSARHVWMQMQPAGSLPSCGADFWTLVDMLPFWKVVDKIIHGGGECQAILWSLFGISMPGWLVLFGTALGLGGIAGNVALRRSGE